MRQLFVAVSFCLLAGSPAHAWHEVGHKATAAIAFEAMTPAMQREVLEVLEAHPRFDEDFRRRMPPEIANGSESQRGKWALQQASVWPDLVPQLGDKVRTRYHRSRWHYINLLVWLTDEDETALASRLDHNMDTMFSPPLRQNLNVIQALRGNLQVWHDPAARKADRAVALCWIVHLAGDLHQPLHTVALFSADWFPDGDRGGNSIEVQWGDETRNLHAVWDGLPTDMADLSPSARTLRSIREDVVDDAAIDEWLSHHASLARKFVYTDEVKGQLVARLSDRKPPVIELSRDYLVAARSIARRQINLAGHRIAALLD
jgi:hypothetical protein